MAKANAVRDNATLLLENLFVLRVAIAAISKSHFANHEVLFKQAEETLHELMDIAEKLAELYNKILDTLHPEAAGSDGTGRLKIDLERTKLRAQSASETTVALLIYQAKRGAFLDLGAAKPIGEMMLADLTGDPP